MKSEKLANVKKLFSSERRSWVSFDALSQIDKLLPVSVVKRGNRVYEREVLPHQKLETDFEGVGALFGIRFLSRSENLMPDFVPTLRNSDYNEIYIHYLSKSGTAQYYSQIFS